MFSVFLTQSGGVLGPIVWLLGFIVNSIYEFLNLFGIQNVGIVIILFTFITRGLMIPLTIKQQKFTKMSAKMNPEIVKIQSKYKGKKDEASLRNQQLETQAVYEKYGAHPTAGCLPLLIQLPIMFALYKIIYNIPAYVNDIREIYNNIAVGIMSTGGYVDIMQTFADTHNVKVTLSDGGMTLNNIIDILSKFTKVEWTDLVNKFPDVASTISSNSSEILKINRFIGNMSIIDKPGLRFPDILIPILATGLQYVQTKQMTVSNPVDKDNPMAASMKTMNLFMPLMSGFFCFTFQIGVGLYWISGSIFAIIQQVIINKYMEKVDIDVLIEKNKEKAKKKKAKKGTGASAKLEELAKKQTKSINTAVNPETERKSTSGYANSVRKNYNPSDSNKETGYKPGSIAANANLLKNRNNDKGDKS